MDYLYLSYRSRQPELHGVGFCWPPVDKAENLRRGSSIFSVGSSISAWAPSHDGRAHQMPMRMNIRRHICLSLFLNLHSCSINDQIIVNTYSVAENLHFNVVASVCTLTPCMQKCQKTNRQFGRIQTFLQRSAYTVPVHLYELGAAETPLPCVTKHFSHCC